MYVLLFLQQCIASGTHIVAKNIAFDLPASTVLLLRAFIAAMMYVIWLSIARKKIKRIEKKDIPTLLILGVLNIPLNQFLFLTAIHYTSAPNVALAYALVPVFVLIIAYFTLKEKISIMKIAGILTALIGIILIFFERGFDFSSDHIKGDLLILGASFSFALYTIIGKNFIRKYGAVYSTGLAMGSGFIFFIPVYFISADGVPFESVTSIQWAQILYLGTMTSGVAYVIWFFALKKIEAGKVAIFNNIQPVTTTIFSIIAFGHILTIDFLLGGLLIVGGVVLTQKG